MYEDADFELLRDIINEDKESDPEDVEDHPVIIKHSWTSHHTKFTRKITASKNIFQEVQGLGLDETVVDVANQIYQYVCEKKNVSGKRRRGVICTCVYYAYNQIEPNGMSYDEAIKIFRIENKVALKGFKFVNSFNNCALTCFTATPETYIRLFLKKLNVAEEQIVDILKAYKEHSKIMSFSSHPRPQSLAAAYIYYHKNNIELEHLTMLTCVSQLTIEKFEREIRNKIDSP